MLVCLNISGVFPKIRSTILGGLHNQDYIVFGALYLISLCFGELPSPV